MILPRYYTEDNMMSLIQSRWSSIINPYLQNPLNNCQLLTNLSLATGTIPYTFTVSSANASVGAIYTHNGQSYQVQANITAGTVLSTTGTGTPLASGTLTKSSGTGDATITFSAFYGTTTINHGLGRLQQGWFITDIQGIAQIYRSQPFNTLTLALNSNAAVTVNLAVF